MANDTAENTVPHIVGCFLYDANDTGRFVILHRRPHKPDGNTWGLPAGKIRPGEAPDQGMVRELYEETGYQTDAKQLVSLGDFTFGAGAGHPYIFSAYRLALDRPHAIRLEAAAHDIFQWVTAEECYAMSDLISDFHALLERLQLAGAG